MFENLLLQRLCSPSVPAYWLMAPSAFFLAMTIGLAMRSVFDLRHPIAVGDYNQSDRNALVWMFIIGLASAIWAALALLWWSGAARPPLQLIKLLIGSMGGAGGVLALRSAVRRFLINDNRTTYQDDIDYGGIWGTKWANRAPADTLGLWIGCLMMLAAFSLWQAAFENTANLAAKWC